MRSQLALDALQMEPALHSWRLEPHMEKPLRLEAKYANYFQVGQNTREFIIEFGQFHVEDSDPLVHTRIVTAPSFAKSFLTALAEAVASHEERYGPIEEP